MNGDERRVIASRMAAELEAETPEGETSWEARNRPLNRVLRCVGHAAGQGASNVVTLERLTRFLGWRFSVAEIRALLDELSRRRIVRKLDVPPDAVEFLLEEEALACETRIEKGGMAAEDFRFLCLSCGNDWVLGADDVCGECRRRRLG